MKPLQSEILKTLLYYDIWHHPLTARELFAFLPVNSMSFEEFFSCLQDPSFANTILSHDGYYFVKGKTPAIVDQRKAKELHARKMWRRARMSMHIIRRFPFVRAIFVSGDLSKNVTNRHSDIDFFIVTEPQRLWIARTLLILFKKTILLNSKKYFCLNYFTTSDQFELDSRSVFLATEIATLKPLCNERMFHEYVQANQWIRSFFPNFDIGNIALPQTHERPSVIQRILEFPFRFLPSDHIDSYLLEKMKHTWARRYPEYDEQARERLFRCTKQESRAYVGNFEEKILAIYAQKLKDAGVAD